MAKRPAYPSTLKVTDFSDALKHAGKDPDARTDFLESVLRNPGWDSRRVPALEICREQWHAEKASQIDAPWRKAWIWSVGCEPEVFAFVHAQAGPPSQKVEALVAAVRHVRQDYAPSQAAWAAALEAVPVWRNLGPAGAEVWSEAVFWLRPSVLRALEAAHPEPKALRKAGLRRVAQRWPDTCPLSLACDMAVKSGIATDSMGQARLLPGTEAALADMVMLLHADSIVTPGPASILVSLGNAPALVREPLTRMLAAARAQDLAQTLPTSPVASHPRPRL